MTHVGFDGANEQWTGSPVAAEHVCDTVGFLYVTDNSPSAVELNEWHIRRIDTRLTVYIPEHSSLNLSRRIDDT